MFPCECDEQRLRACANPKAGICRPATGWPWEEANGCNGPAPEPVERWDGAWLDRCPTVLVPRWCYQVLWLAQTFERGALPDAGGVLDQPAAVMDAFLIVAAARADCQAIKRQRDKDRQGEA